MAIITPGGSASVAGGNAPLSFPLMPQAWPLTQMQRDGVLAVALVPAAKAAITPTATLIQNALVQAGEAGSRLR